MNINSLSKTRNYLYDESGDKYLDLSISPIKDDLGDVSKSLYVVNAETEMRLDLISIKFFGTASYIDLICEANSIFNPFSVMAGEVLVIPLISGSSNIYETQATESSEIRDQFKDTVRMSKEDQTRIDRIVEISKGKKGYTTEPLPPNMMEEGEHNNVLKDGKIILGNDTRVT